MTAIFESAWQKIERARRHADDLETEINAFRKSHPYQVETVNAPPDDPISYRLRNVRPLPANIPLVAGDAAHNIRSALDHLAWATVSKAQRGAQTAFPIWGRKATPSPDEWQKKINRSLKGAPTTVIEAVSTMSPWETGEHKNLWIIHELDRIDKHRLLLSVAATNTAVIFEVKGVMATVHKYSGGRPGMPVAIEPRDWRPIEEDMILWHGNTFDVDPSSFSFDITFGEPEPLRCHRVVPALRILTGHAEVVIRNIAALI